MDTPSRCLIRDPKVDLTSVEGRKQEEDISVLMNDRRVIWIVPH